MYSIDETVSSIFIWHYGSACSVFLFNKNIISFQFLNLKKMQYLDLLSKQMFLGFQDQPPSDGQPNWVVVSR